VIPTSIVTIVNAIVSDLEANAGLTPLTVRSYAEPTMVSPSETPHLAVWCEDTDFQILSAGIPAYDRSHSVNVAWYVADTGAAETGGASDPATLSALDVQTEQLIARIVTYSDGVPGLALPLVAFLRSRNLTPQGGAVWRALLKLSVEEAA
jgi:hypothetical protein